MMLEIILSKIHLLFKIKIKFKKIILIFNELNLKQNNINNINISNCIYFLN